MAYSEADIAALKQALALGVRRVRYPDGSELEYRTLEEMRATLAMMEAEVAGTSARGRSRAVRVRF